MVKKQRKAIGYVRVSRTGTPCGWCAMLISRGFVPKSKAYSSQVLAGPTKAQLDSGEYPEGDKYHPNCHCYAEPVFSQSQVDSDPRFALNRQYAAEWQTVIKDQKLTGDAAMTVWRKHIRDAQPSAVPVAA